MAAARDPAPEGAGAVRDVIEMILKAQRSWDEAVADYLARQHT